jgi:hypothetical protein
MSQREHSTTEETRDGQEQQSTATAHVTVDETDNHPSEDTAEWFALSISTGRYRRLVTQLLHCGCWEAGAVRWMSFVWSSRTPEMPESRIHPCGL